MVSLTVVTAWDNLGSKRGHYVMLAKDFADTICSMGYVG